MITADDLVRREVGHCVSSLVSLLANSGYNHGADDLGRLMDQAQELAAPIPDYEEAAREAGWYPSEVMPGKVRRGDKRAQGGVWADDWQEACRMGEIEPYDREVFEHWIVSDWLADKLAEKGEFVDKDFAGLTVWARTTTGQSIAIDSVIEAIVADLNKAG